jgi:hypothetical protein
MASPDIERKYAQVWEQIKQKGICAISAHKAYHRRIKKALRKEKDQDLLYKMNCLEANPPIVARVKTKTSGSVITFRLIIKPLITVDTI